MLTRCCAPATLTRVRLWKYISARALANDLTDAGYPVSEDVVQRWKRQRHVDPRAADRVSELLGLDMEKEPPEPKWVERLEMKLDQIVENQGRVAHEAEGRLIEALAPPENRGRAAALIDQLEELLRLRAEAPHEKNGESDPAEESPQVQGDG